MHAVASFQIAGSVCAVVPSLTVHYGVGANLHSNAGDIQLLSRQSSRVAFKPDQKVASEKTQNQDRSVSSIKQCNTP